MANRAGVRVVYNLTQRVTADIEAATADAVDEAAFNLQERAQDRIRENDSIDTGALLNSIYTSTTGGISGRAAALTQARAKGRQPGTRRLKNGKLQSPHGHPTPAGTPSRIRRKLTAKVAASMEYALPVEFGHLAVRNTKRMSTRKSGRTAQRISDRRFGTVVPAKPFLMPSAEEARAELPRLIARNVSEVLS